MPVSCIPNCVYILVGHTGSFSYSRDSSLTHCISVSGCVNAPVNSSCATCATDLATIANCKQVKAWKYSDNYLMFGFTIEETSGVELPVCVIWSAVICKVIIASASLGDTYNQETKSQISPRTTDRTHSSLNCCSSGWSHVMHNYNKYLILPTALKPWEH